VYVLNSGLNITGEVKVLGQRKEFILPDLSVTKDMCNLQADRSFLCFGSLKSNNRKEGELKIPVSHHISPYSEELFWCR